MKVYYITHPVEKPEIVVENKMDDWLTENFISVTEAEEILLDIEKSKTASTNSNFFIRLLPVKLGERLGELRLESYYYSYNLYDVIGVFTDYYGRTSELNLRNIINELESISNAQKIQNQSVKCTHPKKYLNVISKSLQFMVCPDCKEEC